MLLLLLWCPWQRKGLRVVPHRCRRRWHILLFRRQRKGMCIPHCLAVYPRVPSVGAPISRDALCTNPLFAVWFQREGTFSIPHALFISATSLLVNKHDIPLRGCTEPRVPAEVPVRRGASRYRGCGTLRSPSSRASDKARSSRSAPAPSRHEIDPLQV